MRFFLAITFAVFMVSGCKDKNEQAYQLVNEYVSAHDNGSTKLKNLSFHPDLSNSDEEISGYVCGDSISPAKDGGEMILPFYAHVSINSEVKQVTDAKIIFDDNENKQALSSKCK
ncbi:hypothetical protein [Serratia entomophila]|uniref:hypothetical protein n=1 Tax=Serratia entomophila TaxID=42906 RepID=UPI0021B76D79|nr:hypothetical protein [Serratia entomophila]